VAHAAALEALPPKICPAPVMNDLLQGRLNQVIPACLGTEGAIDECRFFRAVMESGDASKESKDAIEDAGLGYIFDLTSNDRISLDAQQRRIEDLGNVYGYSYRDMLEAIVFIGNVRTITALKSIGRSDLDHYVQAGRSADAHPPSPSSGIFKDTHIHLRPVTCPL